MSASSLVFLFPEAAGESLAHLRRKQKIFLKAAFITSTSKLKAGLPEKGEGHGRIVYVTQMCDVRLN